MSRLRISKAYGDGDARRDGARRHRHVHQSRRDLRHAGAFGPGKSTFLDRSVAWRMPTPAPSWWTAATSRCSSPPTVSTAAASWALSFSSTTWCPTSPSRKTSRSRRTCPKTRSMSTTCCVRWGLRAPQQVPASGFGRPDSSAAPSAVRSSRTRVCCCATPRARSTIRRPRKSCSLWKTSTASTAAPSLSSPTMPPSRAWPIACCDCATGASSRMKLTSRPSQPDRL